MFQEQIEAYAPHMREAFKDVIRGHETQYYRQGDLDLASSADLYPWAPSQDVRDYVPNIEQIPVQLVDDTTDFNVLISKFIEHANIGLVLMGQNISRRKRPSLIVLTTYEVFYVIDPDYRRGIQFLDKCLKDERLTIWTTNGLHEANCLLEQFNISLLNSQARDCLGVHLHLMKVIACIPKSLYQTTYPYRAITHAHRTLRLESFNKLIYIWLGIDDSDSIQFVAGQLAHLSQRPLNLTGVNLIKKRCCLVLRLAEALMYYVKIEHNIINRNVLNSLAQLREDTTIKTMRKYICTSEERKRPVYTYFLHLDGETDDE